MPLLLPLPLQPNPKQTVAAAAVPRPLPTAATDVQIRPARTAAAAAAGAARSSRCRCRRPPLPSSGRPRRRQPSLPACIPRQSRRRRPRPRPFHVRKQTTRLFFSKLYRSPTPSFPHRNCASPGAAARRGAARAFNLHCISRSCFFILESPPARARPLARPRAGWLVVKPILHLQQVSLWQCSAPFRLPTTAERVASGPLCRRRRRRCRRPPGCRRRAQWLWVCADLTRCLLLVVDTR